MEFSEEQIKMIEKLVYDRIYVLIMNHKDGFWSEKNSEEQLALTNLLIKIDPDFNVLIMSKKLFNPSEEDLLPHGPRDALAKREGPPA